MSRTYRRKTCTHSYKDPFRSSYGWSWEWNGRYVYRRHLEGKEFKKDKARFRADHKAGRFNAPKWFRQELNRKNRSKNKAILARAVREGHNEPIFVPNKDTANWEWW